MARDEAKVKFSADDSEVANAWRKQFDFLDRLEKKIDQVTKAAEKAGSGGMRTFTDWVNGAGLARQAIDLVIDTFRRGNEANQKFRQEVAKTTIGNDVVWRKLYNMGGVNRDAQAQQKLRGNIYQVAEDLSLDPMMMARAATEMFSQGVSMEQLIDQGGLRTFGSGLVSLNLHDTQDPETIIQGLSRAISNTGGTVDSAKSWQELFAILQQFQDTPLALPDLARFASEMGILTNMANIDPATQVATFSSLLTQFDPGVASTAYRNFVMALKDAGRNPQALKALGLKAEDVDFIGEDQQTVLDRLGAGYEALAAKDQAAADAALIKIFKKEGSGGAEHLIRNRERIRESRARVSDPDAAYQEFEANVDDALTGDAVAVRQAEIRAQALRDRPGAGLQEAIRSDLHTKAIELGYTPQQAEAFQRRYDYFIGEGQDPVKALESVSKGLFGVTEFGQWLPGSDKNLTTPGTRIYDEENPYGRNQPLYDAIIDSNKELIEEVKKLRQTEEDGMQSATRVISQFFSAIRTAPGMKVQP